MQGSSPFIRSLAAHQGRFWGRAYAARSWGMREQVVGSTAPRAAAQPADEIHDGSLEQGLARFYRGHLAASVGARRAAG